MPDGRHFLSRDLLDSDQTYLVLQARLFTTRSRLVAISFPVLGLLIDHISDHPVRHSLLFPSSSFLHLVEVIYVSSYSLQVRFDIISFLHISGTYYFVISIANDSIYFCCSVVKESSATCRRMWFYPGSGRS